MLHKWKFYVNSQKQPKSIFQLFVLVLKLMNHARQYEEKKILRVASSNVVYGTQASRHAQNEGIGSGISRQMPITAWVRRAKFVGRLSMLFNPHQISDQRFSIDFKYGGIAGQYICCSFSSSRKSMMRHTRCAGTLSSWNANKICLEVSPSKWNHFGF